MPKQSRDPMLLKTYRVPEPLFRRVQARCERERVNVTDVIRSAFEEWAKDEPDPQE